jgi:hypothetical protein
MITGVKKMNQIEKQFKEKGCTNFYEMSKNNK